MAFNRHQPPAERIRDLAGFGRSQNTAASATLDVSQCLLFGVLFLARVTQNRSIFASKATGDAEPNCMRRTNHQRNRILPRCLKLPRLSC
jgi:hypothetical protein